MEEPGPSPCDQMGSYPRQASARGLGQDGGGRRDTRAHFVSTAPKGPTTLDFPDTSHLLA